MGSRSFWDPGYLERLDTIRNIVSSLKQIK